MKMGKLISDQGEWINVAEELNSENLKLASYDTTLIPLLGQLVGKKVLDYGCGPGVLALTLQKLGANVNALDISAEMLKLCSAKIGENNVHFNFEKIPQESFDHIICNLVVCIVSEKEVEKIANNIKRLLKKNGTAYIGFCNPKIFNVHESQLDFREKTSFQYKENHSFKKIKKEGNYKIVENHRPIEWYEKKFREIGLEVEEKKFTPEYELEGN